ncbi:hypothetical protein Q9Q95_11410 [Sphingomonas sp. DG1-23]|uniref:hypothetical protein n=1 Tax=Sphingomonas sp. DG1-23 TaxID=3068316 RepID=UPI00273EFD44|nr:hypothetical protein [Sphingomonas sp. DG1-23]MDP5279531.1 hypothetical protein [Sphingomonas sp. DG1-23]
MSSVGGASGSNGNDAAQASSREAANRAADAARSTTTEAAKSTPKERDLVDTAVNGAPVAAGQALATLDRQNGDRSVTDRQVDAARAAATTNVATNMNVSQSLTTNHAAGVQTTKESQTTTRSSVDGVEQDRATKTTETKTGVTGWSRTTTETQTQAAKNFDSLGRPAVDRATGVQTETVNSQVQTRTETKVGPTGVSHSQTVSGQTGALNGSASGAATLDANGVGGQGKMGAGAGPANANAGIGLQVGKDGVSVNGSVGGSIGGLGAQHSVSQQVNDKGVKTTTTTSVSLATPAGQPVSAKVEYKQTSVEQLSRTPTSTTYSVTGEMSVAGTVAADVRNVQASVGVTVGQRTVHTVSVPTGVDVATIDVTKPADWPAGTKVSMNSEDYAGTAMAASISAFGFKNSVETRQGQSISMEKMADGRIGVSVGPTQGVTADTQISVGFAGVSAGIGNKTSLDTSVSRSFNIDLSAPGGMQTFNDTLTARQAPVAEVNGVSGLKTVEVSQMGVVAGLSTASPFGSTKPGNNEVGRTTRTTYADGRVDIETSYDANADGKVDLTMTRQSVDGTTFSAATYRYSEQVTQQNQAATAQLTNNPNLKVGDTVSIELSEAQLAGLRRDHPTFGTPAGAPAEIDAFNQLSFASHLARSVNHQGVMQEIAFRQAVTQQNRPDLSNMGMPGTITVNQP